MSQSLVPPPMSLRVWVVLFVVAIATIYLGLLREANSAPVGNVATQNATFEANASIAPVRSTEPVRTVALHR